MSGTRYAQWSRRDVLQGGLLAGLGTLLPMRSRAADANADAAAQARLPVITKVIPSTGERIPVMGIGINQFRGDNYDELRAVLQRMHELGGSVIDTATGYGESEAVIGHALADLGIRKQTFIATKFNAEGTEGHQDRRLAPRRPVDLLRAPHRGAYLRQEAARRATTSMVRPASSVRCSACRPIESM